MSAFFGELRRRGVLGAVLAWGVASAGALQLADIVVHNLDLPGWTVRALIWVAVLGLPVVAVVSWFYDLTRRGLVRTQAPPSSPQTPRAMTPRTSPAAGASEKIAPGTLLAGRYRVEGELGKGGMGRVLTAVDDRIGRRVAVKVVTGAHDPARVARFEQEARTAGSLEHPNVLAVYDLGEHDGVPFLVTELLHGHTLRTLIDKGPLSPGQAHDLALQLARGLAAAHARGIVHRDLKPENLFVTTDSRLKILDFGLARLIESADGPGLTQTGAVFGTPGYLSPEQARGEKAGPPSDVVAAGAVIYEMLSGRRAFPGGSLIEAGHAALTVDPPPLSMTISPALEGAVFHALAKD
ncbi:MAG: serine/threonine protein kinase, partial [Myxococcales bacterium]|nr:serine/threonine protein kinase [Myxococcales bacterium]